MRAGKPATWARWRSDVGVAGVWVAGATLLVYWGLTIVSFLLRALNDPTTEVAALRRLHAVVLRGRLIDAAELDRLRKLDR